MGHFYFIIHTLSRRRGAQLNRRAVSTPTVYRRETFKVKHARGEEKHPEDYWTYLAG